MNGLYPPLHPYVRHSLAVDPPHVLHVEECGNPGGIPVRRMGRFHRFAETDQGGIGLRTYGHPTGIASRPVAVRLP